MTKWRFLNDEGKDRQLDVWADTIKSYMIGEMVLARQEERKAPHHTVEELCNNGGFTKQRWADVRERMVARGMNISYAYFKGYWWSTDSEDVKTILQHPMYVITGVFKSVRKTAVAMAQGGHDPGDVNRYISDTGVRPEVFCKTISTWDGVDPLPKLFQTLLLGPGTDQDD